MRNGAVFYEPDSLEEATRILAEGESVSVLAGGQTLVEAMNRGELRPRSILSLGRIEALKGITSDPDGGVTIGAMTTHRELAETPILSGLHRLLALAAREIGSPAIRNLATIGGSLCRADAYLDYPAPLLALDAELHLRSCSGERTVSVADLFEAGSAHTRQPHEILVRILLPPSPAGALCVYERVARSDQDVPIVSLALGLEMDGVTCRLARIGVGSCGPAPIRSRQAEARLEGTELGEREVAFAIQVLLQNVAPVDDLRGTASYRRAVLPGLLRRALRTARRVGV